MGPVRILYVNGGIMSRGGIESFMMNYYRRFDKEKIQVDFIVHGFEKGIYDDEIINMGGEIINVPVKSKDYFGNINKLNEIFSSKKYKIIHSHMDAMSMVVLRQAKKCGIPFRIAHSHNTQHLTNNRIKYLLNEYARKNITRYATHYIACSEPAARWLFGNKNVENNSVSYVKNAIELDKFRFNLKERNEIRYKYNLGNSFVVGHVGRFDHQKNHMFLLEMFKKLLNDTPNSTLLLVGDGYLRNEIERKIEELNIKDNVILAGSRDDVNYIMNAFDVFCLPSKFEGLGIVLIEAQANGLGCVASNEVPLESRINSKIQYISLNASQREWVDSLLLYKEDQDREINVQQFIGRGYSIEHEVEKLQNMYLKILGEE